MYDGTLNKEHEPFKNAPWVWENSLKQVYENAMQSGINIGKTRVLQRTFRNVMRLKFPELNEFIQTYPPIFCPDRLEKVIRRLLTISDAATAQHLLESKQ
jgi:hypothetical protein